MIRACVASLRSVALMGAVLLAASAASAARAADSAEELFNTRFCFACHSLQHSEVKKLGPYMADVAGKYASQPGSKDYLIGKVLGGSHGVWGDPAVSVMPPNKITPEEAAILVPWVLQQK